MKYLLVLLAGFLIGVGEEFMIPDHLWVTVGSGCIRQKSDGMVFLPQLRLYNPKIDPYPIKFGGRPMKFVPSYRYAYALLSGELSYLGQEECNDLIRKFLDGEQKELQ